jgi:transposase
MSKQPSATQQFINESEMVPMNHIPAIARMCHQVGLIDIINENIPCNTDIDLGTLVLGMVCDTLSGRSPLYKVEEFIEAQDTELLFGHPVDSNHFNDDALGRALDRIHEKGTLKLFTEISLSAVSAYDLDTSKYNFDTTSVNVWGDYSKDEPKSNAPKITYGYSKDKRFDLKQFMVSMLCVEGNIPISGKMQDGNSGDERLNNEELQRIAKLMGPLKQNIGECIYVADCKLINSTNLPLLDDILFISRLPANFKGHNPAIERALSADNWEKLGVLAATPSPSKNRQRANYKSYETTVSIENKDYRAIVIQTDHLDKRRTKGIENRRTKEKTRKEKEIKSAEKKDYHCPTDARKALEEIRKRKKNNYWHFLGEVESVPVHAPGRAPKNGQRKIISTKYRLRLKLEENSTYYEQKLRMAGCFVMITNVPTQKMTSREILKTYKEQYGVEQNFSFLKEPLIANDTFLKKASRIDALTLILLISLMIWNLIQRQLRNSAEAKNGELKNLNKQPTQRPTGYLFMCQLAGIIVIKHGGRRFLTRNGIKEQGVLYLKALGFDEAIYTTPPPVSKTQRTI